MPLAETLYAAAVRVLRPALPLLAHAGGKLGRGMRGRRGLLERMEEWAREHRDPARPLVWFHAPSVGEGHQARAVIERFRARRPDAQVAFTFFSPSAERFARSVPAELADYLPLDSPADVRRALDALRPQVIAFSKYDVWPVLAREAAARGVSLLLLSATLPAGSGRLRGPARALLSPAYSRLAAVAAISADDAERFGALGVRPERRTVMGDARFDQAWERSRRVDRGSPLLTRLAGLRGFTLVAGSTWPADEAQLLPALAAVRARHPGMRLLLVPHEPTPAHLEAAEERLAAQGLAHARLSALGARGAPTVVVVDRLGVLGDLYALADAAYVGGGFGTAGLHSVLEPAAFGVPVLFGPRHGNAREARELLEAGAAFAVDGEDAIARVVATLASDEAVLERAGAAAHAYVEHGLGAAERGAELVARFLEDARTDR